MRRKTSSALRVAQVLLAVVSLLVLGGTAFAWSKLNQITDGLTRSDVIGSGSNSPMDEQNILMVGLDTRTDAEGNPLPEDVLDQLHAGGAEDGGDTTDTMIVVHIPAGGGQATAISIPRDSYVQLAGKFGKHKINSAYTYGQMARKAELKAAGESGAQLETDSAQAGAKTAIETVQQLTGLKITHYAAVNLAGFYYVSQAVGGVPVCLKAPVKDSYSGANFGAGPQNVSGAQALQFVRQRHGLPNGDLDRIKRQQVFMASMAKTILSAGTLTDPSKLDALIGAVKKAVIVDTNWDLLAFAQQLHGMSAGSINFVTVPVVSITLKTPNDGDAVQVDPQQVQRFVREQTGGGPSSPSSSASAPPPSSSGGDPALASYVVDVRNSSGVDGLANRVADKLAAAGYQRGSISNSATRRTSTVYYGHGQRSQADAIAEKLGGVAVASDSSLEKDHFRVYLGQKYSDDSSVRPAAAPVVMGPPAGGAPEITADGVTCVN
ncbi:LytR family transcriptional regulator [Amycolatopsis sp. AA4]|uniref:LCP family protein n=1 Tax=Actinomycetes TaxID=1760 RepID=UPI0001B5760B|nr:MULTISPECIES: LCP family protein [Actinomycetes]ATY14752.1 LytR family transcriptional regulator [Amycolatopsis sp. AA4]